MTTPFRLGSDEYVLVRWHDVVPIHDHRHAARLLEDQRGLPPEELERLAEQLTAGDLMLVRTHRPRPALHLPPPRVDEPAPPEPASTVEVRPPTWLALEVRHASGFGYPRASFVLELPDGTERYEQLGDDSRWRADDIPPGGSCRIRFDPPLRLPPVGARGEAREPTTSDLAITLADCGATPTCLPTAAQHLLVVPKPVAHAVRVSDIHFGTSRAVVLPALPEGTPRGQPTPLDTIAAAIAHMATAEPRPLLLVAGHTDTTGSDDTNDALSEARATSVDLLLRGDATGWAAHAQAHHATADVQRVLQWAAVRQGWPCDPGPVDNDMGPLTRAARRAFRERYGQEFGTDLPLDADTSVADWEAVFELYTQELAVLLSDLGGPSRLWPVVRSRSVGTVACGERWPVQAVGVDEQVCDGNRRVEVLFFTIDELPDLTHPTPGYDVYGSSRYRIVPVPPRPRIRLVRLQLRDVRGVPLPDTEYELTEVEGAHVGTTDALGFTRQFLATEGAQAIVRVRGLEYRVVVANGPAAEPVVACSVLNALGHYAGRLAGAGSRHARAAVRNFQWLRGLPITGQLDATTMSAVLDAARS